MQDNQIFLLFWFVTKSKHGLSIKWSGNSTYGITRSI